MRQIRFGIFETNSSATHSLVIGSPETIEKWKNGDLYIDSMNDYATIFKTKEELDQMKETENRFYREDWVNGKEWYNMQDDLTHSSSTITTPKGETLKIICAYGGHR